MSKKLFWFLVAMLCGGYVIKKVCCKPDATVVMPVKPPGKKKTSEAVHESEDTLKTPAEPIPDFFLEFESEPIIEETPEVIADIKPMEPESLSLFAVSEKPIYPSFVFSSGLADDFYEYIEGIPEFQIPDNDIQKAEPAILYAFSNHLYKFDKKEEAIFWFYLAQYRNRYLISILKKTTPLPSDLFARFFRECGFQGNLRILRDDYLSECIDQEHKHLSVVYDNATRKNIQVATRTLGKSLTAYALTDIEKQAKRLAEVLAYEEKFPFQPECLVSYHDLIPEEDRKAIKDKLSSEFLAAGQWLSKNKEKGQEIRNQINLATVSQ